MTKTTKRASPSSDQSDSPADYQPLATQVANHIRDKILSGELKPGTRIRQEAIASECGTSRIPVREALTQLQNEGLVNLTSHVGAKVATLDHGELDEIYLLRECLEPVALSASIPHLGTKAHRELRAFQDEMEDCAAQGDVAHWVEVDRLFHLASYTAAPLPRLLELIDGFWNNTQQYRRAYTRLPERLNIAHMEHRLLIEAIEQRDATNAQEFSLVHIRRTRLELDQHKELF